MPAYEYADPMDFLDAATANAEKPLVVALDSVTDPRNLGTVSSFPQRASGLTVWSIPNAVPRA